MSKIVLTDFFAEWCEPCKMQDPIIEELKKQFKDKVEFKKIDVDIDYELANKHNIRAVPTLIIEKDGIVLKNYVGVVSLKKLEKDLNEIIEASEDMNKCGKPIKVIMQYDDGDNRYIEGDDVEKWLNALDSAIMFAHIHNKPDIHDTLKSIIWTKMSEDK